MKGNIAVMSELKEKIKDLALKQLFKLKLEQLKQLNGTHEFNHPLAYETIKLFSFSFDKMYEDQKMLSILNTLYVEIQTNESREQLFEDMKSWADKEGYSYEQVFK